jgi:transcription elongation factor Elf1
MRYFGICACGHSQRVSTLAGDEDSRICQVCGSRLQTACPHCSARIETVSKSCHACGEPFFPDFASVHMLFWADHPLQPR